MAKDNCRNHHDWASDWVTVLSVALTSLPSVTQLRASLKMDSTIFRGMLESGADRSICSRNLTC